MESTTLKSTRIALSIEGNPTNNEVLDLLRSEAGIGGPQVLVVPAADYLANADTQRTNQLLRAGTSLLLLDASQADKKHLVKHIGIGSPGDSIAYLITARPAAGDRLAYEMFDLTAPQDHTPAMQTASFTGTYPDGSPEPTLTPRPEVTHTPAPSAAAAFVQQITTALNRPQPAVATDTTEPVQQQWIENKTLNWGISQGSEHHGITPQAQSTQITLTFTFIVYLDEQASGNFQWLYLETLGYQSVGATGMNENYHDERGWANGWLQVVADSPSGFYVNSSSPNNVNSSTTYTSSVSFDVGVDTSSGGTASVDVSHSQSETITDWNIQQNDVNNWTFYQNSPWDAREMSWQNDMVSYNAGNFYYQVNDLPSLSTGVMNFSTMSVWNNQATSTDTVPVTIQIGAEWNYVGIKNIWPSYEGEWWGSTYNLTPYTYDIDLGMVS